MTDQAHVQAHLRQYTPPCAIYRCVCRDVEWGNHYHHGLHRGVLVTGLEGFPRYWYCGHLFE